jgi:hypothetical protein
MFCQYEAQARVNETIIVSLGLDSIQLEKFRFRARTYPEIVAHALHIQAELLRECGGEFWALAIVFL